MGGDNILYGYLCNEPMTDHTSYLISKVLAYRQVAHGLDEGVEYTNIQVKPNFIRPGNTELGRFSSGRNKRDKNVVVIVDFRLYVQGLVLQDTTRHFVTLTFRLATTSQEKQRKCPNPRYKQSGYSSFIKAKLVMC